MIKESSPNYIRCHINTRNYVERNIMPCLMKLLKTITRKNSIELEAQEKLAKWPRRQDKSVRREVEFKTSVDITSHRGCKPAV